MAFNEEEARLYLELGMIHVKQKRHETALEDFTRAIEASPRHPLAYQQRGTLHAMREEYEEALADFQAALQITPDSATVHFGMGGALLKMGKYAEAIQHLKRADAQGHPKAAQYIQRAQERLQESAEGSENGELVPPPPPLEALPEPETPAADDAETLNDQGLQLLAKHQYEEALSHFKQAVEINPGFARAHFNAASILQGQGELAEALTHLKHAVEADYEPAKPLAAEVYRRLKQRESQPDPETGDDHVTLSPKELLKNAAQTLTKFARHHCGADHEMVQHTEKGVFGMGERQVTVQEVRWAISMEERYLLQPNGTRESVQGVELDLQQTPHSIIRVTVSEPQSYQVQIMTEEPLPKTKHRALLGKVTEIVPATPQQLLALLNNFVVDGILVKEENYLRYNSDA